MKEKTIKIYRFDELSKEAQMKVVENHGADFVNDDYWYEYVYEDFKDELKSKYGFVVEDMSFRGFWSQGDGASFTGEFVDPIEASEKFLAKYTIKCERDMMCDLITSLEITRDYSQSVHKNSVSCAFNIRGLCDIHDERMDFFLERRGTYDKLERKVNDWKDNMCDKLYKELEDTYDFLTSYDHVADYYTNCDDEEQFLEDGSDA